MIALSQKGILAFKLSSHKVQSVWQQLKSTYLPQVYWTLSASVPGFTSNCNYPKNVSHTWPACDTAKLFKQTPVKKHENKQLTTKFPVSFQTTVQNSFHFLHSSGRFQWLTTCSNQTHSQLQFELRMLVTWCIWQIKPTFPNRQTQLTLLSTHNLNTKFHCASSAMTVPISLSQHSSTYTARQTPMLQAPISRLPVSANIRQAPLLLHTTEPQVFNYSRITLQMWQLNQGHWQSKLDPPWFSCQRFFNFFNFYGN